MTDTTSASPLKPISEWHSGGYIPHWEAGAAPQSINFRLADSLPAGVQAQWREKLARLPSDMHASEERRLLEHSLDAGYGEALLRRLVVAKLVEDALLFFDGECYFLHAWCIMPNHVHVVARIFPAHHLSDVLHSWKSNTANQRSWRPCWLERWMLALAPRPRPVHWWPICQVPSPELRQGG